MDGGGRGIGRLVGVAGMVLLADERGMHLVHGSVYVKRRVPIRSPHQCRFICTELPSQITATFPSCAHDGTVTLSFLPFPLYEHRIEALADHEGMWRNVLYSDHGPMTDWRFN